MDYYGRVNLDMPSAAIYGEISRNSSSSEELLEIIRGLEFNDVGNSHVGTGVNVYGVSIVLEDVNSFLAEEWRNVGDFFDKVLHVLEEDLRVVRNELEVYGQSSMSIEQELINVVQEVNSTATAILNKFNI